MKDDGIRRTPTLTSPVTLDVPNAGIESVEASANASLRSSGQTICHPAIAMTGEPSRISDTHHETVFGASNSGMQVGQLQGTVNVQFHHHSIVKVDNRSMFDYLIFQDADESAKIKDSKANYWAARLVSHFLCFREGSFS